MIKKNNAQEKAIQTISGQLILVACLSNCMNNIIDKMQWKTQKHSNLGSEIYKKSF